MDELGIFIPFVALAIPFFAIWTGHRHKIAKMELENAANGTAEKAAQYASQITKLEDRVAVLERIVTDKGYDVATQSEALRDTRQVEDTDSGVPLNMESKERA